jgi:hypothetical protein
MRAVSPDATQASPASTQSRNNWHAHTLADLRARLATAERDRPLHEGWRAENLDYVNRTLAILSAKTQERSAVERDVEDAEKAVKENSDWSVRLDMELKDLDKQLKAAKGAADADNIRSFISTCRMNIETARGRLAEARKQLDDKRQHLVQIDNEIAKQQAERPKAERAFRMHDYLLSETTASIQNLRRLIQRMDDATSQLSEGAASRVEPETSGVGAVGGSRPPERDPPRVVNASLDGQDLRTCSQAAPCAAQMLNARHLLTFRLDRRGYACVFVRDLWNPFPQPPGIVDGTEIANPISFGGRGLFRIVITTSASVLDCQDTSAADGGSVQAYVDVR